MHFLAKTVLVILFIALVISVAAVGYNYIIDNDEFSHSQMTYLIANGYKPYKDFFAIYSPILHATLLPIFNVVGFSFDGILAARAYMIILFAVRITATFLSVRLVFGKTAALLFIPLLLFDPFTIFSSMQIRPDNLMLTLYSISMLLLCYCFTKNSKTLFFITGALLSLTVLTSIKIAPAVFVALVVLTIHFLRNRSSRNFLYFFTGFLLTIFLFFSYFLMQNSLPEMVQNLFFDAKANSDAIMRPVPLGYFHPQGNIYIYGFGNRMPNWIYVWILPLLGAIGVYQTLINLVKGHYKKTAIPAIILMFSVIAQWFSLFLIFSVFVQYYLSAHYLLAIFAAVAISGTLDLFSKINSTKMISMVSVYVFLVIMLVTCTKANLIRLQFNYKLSTARVEMHWKRIPQGTRVFPNLLFRPSVYPLITGYFYGDLPKSITERFTPIPEVLEKNKVTNLLLTGFYYEALPPEVQSYVDKNYDRIDDELLVRKKE